MRKIPARLTLLLVLLHLGCLLFGQQTITQFSRQVKISPLRVVDLINPGLELGFEKSYGRYSSLVSGAWLKDFFVVTPYQNYKGYKLAFEQKHFLAPKLHYQPYFSAETFFMNISYVDRTLFRDDKGQVPTTYCDTFNLSKQIIGIHIKYGYQIPIKRVTIEIALGLGAKYRRAVRTGIDDPNGFEIPPPHPNVYYEAGKEGNGFVLSIPMNFKVGFSF